MGSINVGARVVKGLMKKNVDDSLASNKPFQIPCFMSIGTKVIEFNNEK